MSKTESSADGSDDQIVSQTEKQSNGFLHYPEIEPLPSKDYKTVLADPPWQYEDDGRSPASDHYETLPVQMIQSLGPLVKKATATHSHLYLWTTNAFLPYAFNVVESWGFNPVTIITWLKVQDSPDTLPHERDEPIAVEDRLGLGRYFRNTTEHLIFAKKGRRQTARNDVPTYFFAERNDHSQKPEKSYRLIEKMSEGPRLEMFARKDRKNWDVWGNEV